MERAAVTGTFLCPLGTLPGETDLGREPVTAVGVRAPGRGPAVAGADTCPVSPRGRGRRVFSLTSPLHGVTFLAFGNGAPDVFSAVVAFSNPRTAGLAIGAVFGKENPAGGWLGAMGGTTRRCGTVGCSPPERDLLGRQAPACS